MIYFENKAIIFSHFLVVFPPVPLITPTPPRIFYKCKTVT